MLSIVLITPRYAELGTPAGLCTAAFAQAFMGHGHAVHVVCALSPAPRPRHEIHGQLTIHRLEVRRGSPPQAFAMQACRRVNELIEANRCDVVECIDAPVCLISIAAQIRLRDCRFPIISVGVDPQAQATPQGVCAQGLADASISTHQTGQNDQQLIPFPLGSDLWVPPDTQGALFIVDDASDLHSNQQIMHAYTQSRARREGWSLAMRGYDGRWSVTGDEHAEHEDQRRVLITMDSTSPIAALHALGQGSLSVISDHAPLLDANPDWPLTFDASQQDSLSRAMNRAIEMPSNELGTLAKSWFDRLSPPHDARQVASAHARVWEEARNRTAPSSHTRLGMWQLLEQKLLLMPTGAHA